MISKEKKAKEKLLSGIISIAVTIVTMGIFLGFWLWNNREPGADELLAGISKTPYRTGTYYETIATQRDVWVDNSMKTVYTTISENYTVETGRNAVHMSGSLNTDMQLGYYLTETAIESYKTMDPEKHEETIYRYNEEDGNWYKASVSVDAAEERRMKDGDGLELFGTENMEDISCVDIGPAISVSGTVSGDNFYKEVGKYLNVDEYLVYGGSAQKEFLFDPSTKELMSVEISLSDGAMVDGARLSELIIRYKVQDSSSEGKISVSENALKAKEVS